MAKPPSRIVRTYLLLASISLGQGVPMAFLQVGLPTVLRGINESLSEIAVYSLLLLPWAGKFLYAPLLDRHYIKRIGRRRTWLLSSLLFISAAFACVAAFLPPRSGPWLMGAVLLVNLLLSVNDTAASAFTSEILTPEQMPWGSAIRLGGSYAGMILGGGALLMAYPRLGWGGTFWLLCLASAAVAVPTLLHREARSPTSVVESDGHTGSGRTARNSIGFWRFALVEVCLVTTMYTGYQLFPPFFIDSGLSSQDIGQLAMLGAYPLAFVAALCSGGLIRRLNIRTIVALVILAELCVQAFAFHLAQAHSVSLFQAGLLLSADMVMGSIAGVALYTLIFEYSVGPCAATQSGRLASIANFTPLLAPPLLGLVGERHGYAVLFATLALVTAMFLGTALLVMRRRPFSIRWGELHSVKADGQARA